MPVKLPKFESPYGQMMTVCGELQVEDLGEVGESGLDEDKVAAYRAAAGMALVRGRIGGKSGKHLHVDCALRSAFPKNEVPKPTHKKAEIVRIIKGVEGLEMEAGISGGFKILRNELPERGLIQALGAEQKTVDISIKVRACTLALTGVPIKSIEWVDAGDTKGSIFVNLEAERTIVVGENYLSEMWGWLEEQFSLFVLGTRKDG